MKHEKSLKRASFTSSLGFIVASAGSAIGLGSLWKFPYVAGSNGGGVFLLFFIIFSVILGIPIILCETAIGRKTQLSAVSAYKKLNKNWAFVGAFGVICSFIIISYYSVIGGWILKYIFAYLTGGNFGNNKTDYFNNFISSPVEPVIWHIIFMSICAYILLKGVVQGIEKVSKVMLPGLFILVLIIAAYSMTLDGALQGLKFLFVPDFSSINSIGNLSKVVAAALGQVFFSLSLGLGITITYGSYLKPETDIIKNTLIVTILNTLISLLCGIAVFPAAYSFGDQIQAGAGLIFETFPSLFDSMKFGILFGFMFFILVFFAAATSAIAMLEVVCAYFIDTLKWERKKSVIIVSSCAILLGILASLSLGDSLSFKIFGLNVFDLLCYFTDKILMPMAAFFMCIFINKVIGVNEISEEILIGTKSFKQRRAFEFIIKYVAPYLIIVIFLMGFFNF